MRKRTQYKSAFALRVKSRLWAGGSSIQDLADRIDRPRSTVSQAINQGRFPRVRKQIEEALAL